jgi:hypothetical protein
VSSSIFPVPLLQTARETVLADFTTLAEHSVKRATTGPDRIALTEFSEQLMQIKTSWAEKGLISK